MPIYEYVCDACGHNLEAIQKITEDRLVYCPSCEKDALRKKISAPGFRLKGGGWYETDFKSGQKKNISASDSKSTDTDKSTTKDDSSSKDKSGSSDSASSSKSSSDSSTKSSESSGSGSGSTSSASSND
jgi:putative FmdB family regulatory protein